MGFLLNKYVIMSIGGLIIIGGIYYTGYRSGKSSIMERLKNDQITILRNGVEIDKTVDNLDDTGLCSVLGGC